MSRKRFPRAIFVWLVVAASTQAQPLAPHPDDDSANRQLIADWIDQASALEATDVMGLVFLLAGDLSQTYQIGLTPGGSAIAISGFVLSRRIGSCGDLSVTLVQAMEHLGINARLVNLYNVPRQGLGHTLVEFQVGENWIAVDPTYGKAYRGDGGAYLSVAQLSDPGFLSEVEPVDLSAGRFDDEYYTRRTAFLNANPIGTISPAILTVFPIPVANQARIAFGEPDDSNADLLDPNNGLPAGLDFLGTSYMSRAHRWEFSKEVRGQIWKVRYRFANFNPSVQLEVVSGERTILNFQQISPEDRTLTITYVDADGSSLLVRPKSISDSPRYLLVDSISVTRLPQTSKP